MVAQQLAGHQGLDPGVEIVLGGLGQPPDGLIAEHRLQHPLGQHRGAAGHPDFGADQPAGVREDHDHQGHPDAVDSQREEAGPRPLAHALVGDEVEHGTLPVADRPFGRPREPG